MELRTYLSIIMRRWKILLLFFLIICFAFGLASVYIRPSYQADATLQVITPLAGSLGDTYHETTFATRLMNTYAQIATSEQVMDDLKTKLGVNPLPDISVKIIPDSEIIQIVVKSPSPSLAVRTANGMAELIIAKQNETIENNIDSEELAILKDRRDELEKSLGQSNQKLDQLISDSSQATADLAVLDRNIKLKEASYQDLQNQYQQALIAESVAPSSLSRVTTAAIKSQISSLEKDLEDLDQKYKEQSAQSNEYSQKIAVLRQTIQNDQNAYSDILNRYDSVLSSNLRQERAQDIVLVSPAVEPVTPTGFGRKFIIGLGVICGLILGAIASFLFDNLDTRIFSTDQVGRATNLPVLGSFPKLGTHGSRDNSMLNAYSNVHRDYVMLCARLKFLIQEKSIRTILITSANPMEGKSTITSALANGLAQNNCKVLVIDADLRRPRQQEYFRISGENGLETFLRDDKFQLNNLIHQDVKPGIDILPSMAECKDPTNLLQPSRFSILFENVRKYDAVLLDTPALLVAPDAYSLAKTVDGVVVIVQLGRTRTQDLHSICEHWEAVGARLLGVVINQVPVDATANYYNRKTSWRERFYDLRRKFMSRSPKISMAQFKKLR